MPWIQSHDNIAAHPKTRRAARMAGVSVPTMVGHLHMLWHWTLGVAPDGNLSRFEADDLADAAAYEGDPDAFLSALMNCGPGDSFGFIEPTMHLHDWVEYGGRYFARSNAGKAGAKARWDKKRQASDQAEHAIALRTHSDANGDRNAEERRGELTTRDQGSVTPSKAATRAAADAAGFEEFWKVWRRKADKHNAARAFTKAMRGPNAPTLELLIARARAQLDVWDREQRAITTHAYASSWLNARRWEDDELIATPTVDHHNPYAGQVFR